MQGNMKNGKIRLTSSQLNKKVNEVREERKNNVSHSNNKKSKKRKIRSSIKATALAVLLIGGSITAIQANANANKKDLQYAITQAMNDVGWLEENFIQEGEKSDKQANKLERAIAQYSILESMPELRKNDYDTYKKICKEISGSTDSLCSQYTKVLQEKIAEAYGIKNPADVTIQYIVDDMSTAIIQFQKDGKTTKIESFGVFPKIPKDLFNEIKNARTIKDVVADPKKEIDKNAIEKVISTYGKMEKLKKADVSLDDKGKLSIKYENERNIQKANEIENEERG